MSVQATTVVWRWPIYGSTKLIALYLADAANQEGGNAHPSIARMSTYCGVQKRRIQRILRELEARGMIVKEREHDPAGKRPTTWRIVMNWAGDAVPAAAARDGAQDTPTGGAGDASRDGPHDAPTSDSGAAPTGGAQGREQVAPRTPEPSINPKNIYIPTFEDFRAAYPHPEHDPDKPAREAWDEALAGGADPAAIVAGARQYAAYCSANHGWHTPCRSVRYIREERWRTANDQAAGRPEAGDGWLPPALVTPSCPPEQAARWLAIQERIAQAKGKATCRSWFGDVVFDGERLLTPSRFVLDTIEGRFFDLIDGLPLAVHPEASASAKSARQQ